MSAPDGRDGAEQLGLDNGMVVQELGWDEDADAGFRDAVMDIIDADMIEDAVEAVDAVLLWWRDEDGDIVDGLFDAMRDLTDDGFIWVLTPKVGRPGFIDPSDLDEGADIAGLQLTSTVMVSDGWQANKMVRPKGSRRS